MRHGMVDSFVYAITLFQKGRDNWYGRGVEGSKGYFLQATPVASGSFPLVHEGFQEVYTHIRKKLIDVVFPVLQRQLATSLEVKDQKEASAPLALPKIYATGHSLGGSLAQLLALDVASNCEIVLPTTVSKNDIFSKQPRRQKCFTSQN
eukprot:scaffold7978_cov124-Cylindrotheca_fusiformis.AAC.4